MNREQKNLIFDLADRLALHAPAGNTDLIDKAKEMLGPVFERNPSTEPVGLGYGYSRAELADAFDLVKPPGNWKLPVHAEIPTDKIKVVEAAITFFAGGDAEFSRPIFGRVIVTAPGYYALIGS